MTDLTKWVWRKSYDRPDKMGIEDLHQLEKVTGLCQPTCTKQLTQLFDASNWVTLEALIANLDLQHNDANEGDAILSEPHVLMW